jgi:hypothetical protein
MNWKRIRSATWVGWLSFALYATIMALLVVIPNGTWWYEWGQQKLAWTDAPWLGYPVAFVTGFLLHWFKAPK